jgi:hypothetical protein
MVTRPLPAAVVGVCTGPDFRKEKRKSFFCLFLFLFSLSSLASIARAKRSTRYTIALKTTDKG